MASAQRLRELAAELIKIKAASGDAQTSVYSLANELERLAQRATDLKGGLIGGSETEVLATQRNLKGIIDTFTVLQNTGQGAFNTIIQSIGVAIRQLEILNDKQRQVFEEQHKWLMPDVAFTPQQHMEAIPISSQYAEALSIPPSRIPGGGNLQKVAQDTREVAESAREAFPEISRLYDELAKAPLVRLLEGDQLNQQFRAISGSAEQLGVVLKNNTELMNAVVAGTEHLEQIYSKAGLEVNEFTVAIDGANNAIRVTAQATGAVKSPLGEGDVAEIARISESVTVGLGDAQIVNRAQELQKAFSNLGVAAGGVQNLQQALEKLGFSLEHIGSAQADANEGIIRFNASNNIGAGITNRASIVMDRNGQIVETVKRKYEGFGTAITNSINKVLRWGIAVGVVYGTLNRVRAAITEMIDLQVAFADIQIITGKSAGELGTSLETIVEAAQRTGITITEATSAFEKSLRAAGRVADEAERVAMAEALMADALILARLANVDQAQAMDMLTGALRQQGLEINQGTVLLDKWVATSKIAFVGLQDLAESFAITAAQASSVGVSIDELNGIIGTIAEVTTLSSTEIGNFARTILSALESDTAIKTLREYGVAVKDASGDLRDWADVIQDVYDLWRTEAISERELSAIGRALGGGARRGPQTVAFMKEFGRVSEIAAESAAASGDAADALDIKMDTLRNTINELSVEFSKLALGLGEEGGLLEFMTNIVKATSSVISILEKITDVLGDTTTQVIALTAAYSALSKAGIFSRLGGAIGAGAVGGQLSLPGFGTAQAIQTGTSLGQRTAGVLRTAAPAIGGGIGAAAISYMSTGSPVQAVGSGIGGAIGTVLGGPVGLLVGSTIGGVIAEKITEAGKAEIQREQLGYLAETGKLGGAQDAIGAMRALAKTYGGAEKFLPVIDAASAEELTRWSEHQLDVLEQHIERDNELIQIQEKLAQSRGLDADAIIAMTTARKEGITQIEKEIERIKLLTDLMNNYTEIQKTAEGAPSAFAVERADIRRQFAPGLRAELDVGRQQRIRQLAAGEIPRAAYTRYLQVAEQLPQVVTNITQLLGEQMVETFGEGQAAFNELGMALADLDPAAIEFITERLEKVTSLRSEMEDFASSTRDTAAEMAMAASLQEQYGELAAETAEEIVALIEGAKRAAAEPIRPQFTRYDIGQEEFNQIFQQALANQAEYARFVGISSDEIASSAEDWKVVVEGNLNNITGLWKTFFDDALQSFQEAQQRLQDSQFHVRRLQDVDPSQMGQIQAQNRFWIEYLARIQGMTAQQYIEEEGYTENLILGPNNVWQKILTTSEAMNFTLQDILETEKKQLEGQWNIPSGATFWVPLTSLFYQDRGGGGTFPELPPLEEPEPAPTAGVEEAAIIAGRSMFAGAAGGLLNQVFTILSEMGTADIEESALVDRQTEALVAVIDQIRQTAIGLDVDPRQYAETILNLASAAESLGGFPERLAEGLYAQALDALNIKDVLDIEQWEPGQILELIREAAGQLAADETGAIPAGLDLGTMTSAWDNVILGVEGVFGRMMEFFTNPMDPSVEVSVISEKDIVIQNVISLDGKIITQFVSEILARETATSARATGATVTLKS